MDLIVEMRIMDDYTQTIKNIIKGWEIIWNSRNLELIGKMHTINDYYQNQRETIIYGDTIKNLREKMAK